MTRWIRWSQWSEGRMVDFGQMPIENVDKTLREFEAEAKKILEKTKADHVLYGVKRYDREGRLDEVRFYLKEMTDAEFEKDVASKPRFTIYALHKRAGLVRWN